MRRRAALTPWALILGCVATMASCGDSTEPAVPASISISPNSALLTALGETVSLSASVRDSDGGTLADVSVSWTSSDGSVATVSSTGTVTAISEGSAQITATTTGLSSSPVTVTVDQAAASIALTAPVDTLTAGDTVRVVASVTDAGGATVANPGLSWTSSDPALLSVDSEGLLTAIDAGEVTVMASADGSSGTLDMVTKLVVIEPTADMILGGTLKAASMTIPAGVTVTVESDLDLTVEGDAEIAGDIVATCSAVRVHATASLMVRGDVSNTCAGAGPVVSLTTDGPFTVEDATIEPAGELMLGHPEAASSLAPSREAASGAAAGENACRLAGASLGRIEAKNEGPTPSLVVNCNDDLWISSSLLIGRNGASGPLDQSSPVAAGGDGEDGGSVRIQATGTVTFSATLGMTSIHAGDGGDGGDAVAAATNNSDGEAAGGDGGASGALEIKGAHLEIETGALEINTGRAGDGGDAAAMGEDGRDRLPGEAAGPEAGLGARVEPGNGGELRSQALLPNADNVPAVLDVGTHAGLSNITIRAARAGNGGAGNAQAGDAGSDLETDPDAPSFPGATATNAAEAFKGRGGGGGFVDNRSGGATTILGTPGNGGSFFLKGGNGGDGYTDCRVGQWDEGRDGGAGISPLVHADAGAAGMIGATSGTRGTITLEDAGNGGDGGNGLTAGDGGAGGDLSGSAGVHTPYTAVGHVGQDGDDGNQCSGNFTTTVGVANDPSGHEPFIGMIAVAALTTVMSAIEVAGQTVPVLTITGTGPWVALSGNVSDDGTFTLTGSGTVAGFSDVEVTMTGSMSAMSDESNHRMNGTIGSFTGSLSVGTGGRLPGGQAADYTVNGTRNTGN